MPLLKNKIRPGTVIFLILFIGFCLRLSFALTYSPLLGDERGHVMVAKSISLSPGNFYFPLENILQNHLILTDLPLKLGIALFGENLFGVRFFYVLIGFINLMLVYKLFVHFSKEAGAYALALLAFNQFHIAHSGLSFETGLLLLFSTLAIYCFWFGITENRRLLWWLGPIWVLSYCTQEQTVAFAPVFYIFLLISHRDRVWVKSREIRYSYCLFFGIVLFHLVNMRFFGTSLEYFVTPGYVSFSPVPTATGINFFLIKPICKILNIDYLMTVNWEVPLMSALSGIVLFSGIVYSLKDFRNDFKRLLLILACSQLVIFTFVNTVGFGWGEANWSRLSLIPAIGLTAMAFSAIRKRWPYFKYVIYGVFIVMFCQSAVFSFQPKKTYPPHRFATFTDYDIQFIYLYLGKEFPSRPDKEDLEKVRISVDYQKAMNESMEALSICPNEVRLHSYLAESLYKLGRRKLSEEKWLRALELEPFYTETFRSIRTNYGRDDSGFMEGIDHYENGVRYLIQNDPQKAIAEFAQASQTTANKALASFYTGEAYLRGEDPAQAKDKFFEALRYNPKFVRAYIGLAKAYLQEGKSGQAEGALAKAIEINLDTYLAYEYLGKIHAGKGSKSLARKYSRKAKNIIHVTLKGYVEGVQFSLEE